MSSPSPTVHEVRNELYRLTRRDVPFETKAQRVLEVGKEYLETDNGHLTRINAETDHWEVRVSTDPVDGLIPPGLELNLGGTYCRRVVETEKQISISNAQTQGLAEDPVYKAYGVHCYLGTPIFIDKSLYGTVCFVSTDPRVDFSTDEALIAELIGQCLGREIERKKHAEAYQREHNITTVLNRVLRHNLRNDLAVVRGHTQLMAEQLDDSESGEIALRNIDDLIELAEKARQLEQILAESANRTPTSIPAMLEYAVERVKRLYPAATITVDCEDDLMVPVRESFERAIVELIENAAKHAGDAPTVTVSVDSCPDALEIRIVDDGPGLSEQERTVLSEGAETPLVHGSGLGLWLVHWVIDGHNGSIEAAVSDAGTTMTVSIPRHTETGSDTTSVELIRARDQYRAAFDEASDVMLITDNKGRIIDANAACEGVFGLTKTQLLGRPLRAFLPDAFDFDSEWQQFQTDSNRRGTVTIEGTDGVDRIVEYSAAAGVVPGEHLFIAREVTTRVEREAELRMKTHAMDEAPIGITISDPQQKDNPMVYANDTFCELAGRERSEVLGRNCRFMQGKETDPDKIETIRQAIDAGESVITTLRNYKKDGTMFWNRVTISPVTDPDGTIVNWIGFQQDVTDEQQTQKNLDETTDHLDRLLNAVPLPMLIVDADGTIQLWNAAAEDVFGHNRDDVLGTPLQSLALSTDELAPLGDRLGDALAGDGFEDVPVVRHRIDGTSSDLRLTTVQLRDDTDSPAGIMVLATPVDEADFD